MARFSATARVMRVLDGARTPLSFLVAHDILLFATWKTWLGAPLVDASVASQLETVLPLLAAKQGVRLLEAAIVPTHVHVVVRVGTRLDVPNLIQCLKGASARLINRERDTRRLVRWARGYDLRSVGRSGMPRVRAYLDRQSDKHGLPLLARWSAPDQPTIQPSAEHAR